MEATLPKISSSPQQHPDCCLSISTKLICALAEIIASKCRPGPASVLSIGSGSGLLEALLLTTFQSPEFRNRQISIEGVEVHQADKPVNRYLPEQAINTVLGTWSLSPRLQDEDGIALLFVYPRLPALVSKYMARIGDGSTACDLVVWLGPCNDWAEFEPCFRLRGKNKIAVNVASKVEGEEAGLAGYEMMVVMQVQRPGT